MHAMTELLINSLGSILQTEAVTDINGSTITAVFPNPSGGSPVRFTDDLQGDFKVILNKTPRYYPRETLSAGQIQKDITAYANGSTALLDFTYNNGSESKIDRIAKTSDMENLSLSSLVDLCVRISLARSVELKDLLAAGGTVNVHFWDAAKDFRYRQIGDRLEKL